jgi:site-specific recombinase XerD
MFRRLAERAGVTLPRGAPVHALRHTFAHEALDAGIDISQVSQLLRHSNVETTMRYLREDPEALQEIYQQIHRDS